MTCMIHWCLDVLDMTQGTPYCKMSKAKINKIFTNTYDAKAKKAFKQFIIPVPKYRCESRHLIQKHWQGK